jgi:N-acetylneuraminic acid mutarotase
MLLRKNLALNSNVTNDLFDKYLDDITYVIKPSSAISYFQLHFKAINICDMMWFRELTRYDASQDFRKIQIDECFLKVIAEILKTIKNERSLL